MSKKKSIGKVKFNFDIEIDKKGFDKFKKEINALLMNASAMSAIDAKLNVMRMIKADLYSWLEDTEYAKALYDPRIMSIYFGLTNQDFKEIQKTTNTNHGKEPKQALHDAVKAAESQVDDYLRKLSNIIFENIHYAVMYIGKNDFWGSQALDVFQLSVPPTKIPDKNIKYLINRMRQRKKEAIKAIRQELHGSDQYEESVHGIREEILLIEKVLLANEMGRAEAKELMDKKRLLRKQMVRTMQEFRSDNSTYRDVYKRLITSLEGGRGLAHYIKDYDRGMSRMDKEIKDNLDLLNAKITDVFTSLFTDLVKYIERERSDTSKKGREKLSKSIYKILGEYNVPMGKDIKDAFNEPAQSSFIGQTFDDMSQSFGGAASESITKQEIESAVDDFAQTIGLGEGPSLDFLLEEVKRIAKESGSIPEDSEMGSIINRYLNMSIDGSGYDEEEDIFRGNPELDIDEYQDLLSEALEYSESIHDGEAVQTPFEIEGARLFGEKVIHSKNYSQESHLWDPEEFGLPEKLYAKVIESSLDEYAKETFIAVHKNIESFVDKETEDKINSILEGFFGHFTMEGSGAAQASVVTLLSGLKDIKQEIIEKNKELYAKISSVLDSENEKDAKAFRELKDELEKAEGSKSKTLEQQMLLLAEQDITSVHFDISQNWERMVPDLAKTADKSANQAAGRESSRYLSSEAPVYLTPSAESMTKRINTVDIMKQIEEEIISSNTGQSKDDAKKISESIVKDVFDLYDAEETIQVANKNTIKMIGQVLRERTDEAISTLREKENEIKSGSKSTGSTTQEPTGGMKTIKLWGKTITAEPSRKEVSWKKGRKKKEKTGGTSTTTTPYSKINTDVIKQIFTDARIRQIMYAAQAGFISGFEKNIKRLSSGSTFQSTFKKKGTLKGSGGTREELDKISIEKISGVFAKSLSENFGNIQPVRTKIHAGKTISKRVMQQILGGDIIIKRIRESGGQLIISAVDKRADKGEMEIIFTTGATARRAMIELRHDKNAMATKILKMLEGKNGQSIKDIFLGKKTGKLDMTKIDEMLIQDPNRASKYVNKLMHTIGEALGLKTGAVTTIRDVKTVIVGKDGVIRKETLSGQAAKKYSTHYHQ